jgi:hypothetical protein
MVFEIAGGEPSTSDSQPLGDGRGTTSDSDGTLQHSKPLSSVETPQQHLKLASRHAAGLVNESSPAGEPSQTQAGQSNAEIAAVAAQLLGNGQLTADSSAPVGVGQSRNDQLSAEIPDLTALAAAHVFDRLGEGNAAMNESTDDGKSWLRSIGTSPLLMVLALERIAALNSRRVTRESRIAAAKKPLRLRS